jgi:hypothetical protein
MKITLFALIILIFLNPVSGLSQNFNYIGDKQIDIETKVKNSERVLNKKNRRKLKYKFEYSIGVDSSGLGKNKYKKYIKSDYIWYTTPFRSYTDFYYFNDAGVCDSIVVYENVCLECGIREDSSNLFFLLNYWKIISQDEFISTSMHNVSSASKKNDLKCAYIKLTRDLLPENGVCLKWTFVLDEVKDCNFRPLNTFFYVKNSLMFVGILVVTFIMLNGVPY